MKKWVCQNNNVHVFDVPTEDGYCPVCPYHEGRLVEMEGGPVRDPKQPTMKKVKANEGRSGFIDQAPQNTPAQQAVTPVINQFYASKNQVRNEEHFTLSWDVANADKLALYKNDLLIKLSPDQRSIDLRDYFDSNKTRSTYLLVAGNNNREVKSEPVIISFSDAGKKTEKPVIIEFYTNKEQVKNEERFTLSWNVKNADRVELYKNEVSIQLSANQKSIDLKDYFDDNKKHNAYTLIAYNEYGETKSEPMFIALSEAGRVIEKPVIKQFYPSKFKVNNGEQFTISWEVENAGKVVLYRNTVPIILKAGAKSIDLTEVFDSSKNTQNYFLVAFNGEIQTKSEVITIGLAGNKNVTERAVINNFNTDRTKVKSGEFLTLTWDVENADSIELYKNGALLPLEPGKNSVKFNESFEGGRSENSYVIIACKNSIETKSNPIIIKLERSQNKFPVLLIVAAVVVVVFAVYKFIASRSNNKFLIAEKLMYEGSDVKIHTANLSDTSDLHILFNGITGQKKSFTDNLLLVKVPQVKILTPGDSVVVSVMRGDKQLYQTRLAYAETPIPLQTGVTGTPAHRPNQPTRPTFSGTAVSHDLILNNHGTWGQSTAASGGHVAILSWQGSSTLDDGSAGTGFLPVEDGSNYSVLYVRPFDPTEQSAVPDTIKGFFSFPGANGKVFTAKIGFLKGNTNAKATFEIWANNDQGKFILIRQYVKVYDGKIVHIYLQLPQTKSAGFNLQLRVAGNGPSIGAAVWIEPQVIVDQLTMDNRPKRRGRYY